MRPTEAHLTAAKLTAALQPWIASRKEDSRTMGSAMGHLMASLPDSYGMDSLDLAALQNAYVATTLSSKFEKYVALHAKLVEVAGVGVKYDFEHCDRYAQVYLDTPELKTMAFQTQGFTYMVVLRAKTAYLKRGSEDAPQLEGVPTWSMDVRGAAPSSNSYDLSRPPLAGLTMLESREALKASDYFKYRDGRDRGYCGTVRPALISEGDSVAYETEGMSWGAAMSNLAVILQDLNAHASMVKEMAPNA